MNNDSIKSPSPESLAKLYENFALNQGTFKDLFQLSSKDLEPSYATAYNYYNNKKYDKSEEIFAVLCQLDHFQPKYWMGLAASRHMLHKFQNAYEAYIFCSIVDPQNPFPSFHAADCLIKLNRIPQAKAALEATILMCDELHIHPEIREKAAAILAKL